MSTDREALLIRKAEILLQLEKLQCERSLAQFVRSSWHIIEPGTPLVWNWHIDTVCGYLEAFSQGTIKRLIVNIPPGTLKSIIVSVCFPAWEWIGRPDERYLCISNEQGLAIRDALRTKHIVMSEWYQRNWPLALLQDQNEKTLYINEKRGFRQSQGITAANTGKRGGRLLVDDPHDMKQIFSDVQRQSVIDTWDQSLSTRLNNPEESGILIIMQRGHEQDLTGHLMKKKTQDWKVLSIPMLYEGTPTYDSGKDIGRPELNDPRIKKGELLFPALFTKKSVLSLQEDLGEYGSAAQLQQRPSPLGGGIIKSFWFRAWPDDHPLPKCNFIFHSWDTAFDSNAAKANAYSACIRFGIFFSEERDRYCILVLGVWYGRVGYDELRAKVKEFDDKFSPDANLVERKATGISLYYDLKKASRMSVSGYIPREDKISRAHSVTPMLQSGQVYVPNKVWALGDEKTTGLVQYLAKFPAGEPPTADLTDCFTQALIFMRAGKWAGDHDDDKELPYETPRRSDEDEEDTQVRRKKAIYA